MSKNNHSSIPAALRISQNFLTSSVIINRIINLSNINKNDYVIEIGAGKGHITSKLLDRCGKLTAVEIDSRLHNNLKIKFESQINLDLICGDFLKYNLPKTPYKVFANIPFNQTTDIVRKLTSGKNPPQETWLVVEKGAAKRFIGKPQESLSSLLIKPFFHTEINYYFKKTDFHPSPSVDTVLLHFVKKPTPDVKYADLHLYNRFISNCLGSPGAVFTLLTKRQISTALKIENLSGDITSKNMLYVQWLCLFRCWLKYGKLGK